MPKKKIELIILGPLIAYSLYCSLIVGPSWDEFYHYKNGENILIVMDNDVYEFNVSSAGSNLLWDFYHDSHEIYDVIQDVDGGLWCVLIKNFVNMS